MIPGNSPRAAVRYLLVAAPLLALAAAGCGDQHSYPTDLKYPARRDPIVAEFPKATSFYNNPPGSLDESVAKIGADGDGKAYDPNKMAAADRAKLDKALLELFGTPAKPTVAVPNAVEDVDEDVVKQAKEQAADLLLDDKQLAAGSQLYRRYCLQCHGLAGDGRGPTGPWVSPHPRDYRQGIFKFVSTNAEGKPRRDDLFRVLTAGVEGTSMPSFALLDRKERDALVSYVMHLSLRGQVEYEICKTVLSGGDMPSVTEGAKGMAVLLIGKWSEAERKTIVPDPAKAAPPANEEQREASVRRGYEWFVGKEGACIKCHEDFGRQVPFRYDVWGTMVRPANLTAGVYRGGRRPIDIYWRVRGGIPPSQMPAGAGLMSGDDDSKVWDVVNFVQAVPYPNMLPEDVRGKIYDKKEDKPAGHEKHASLNP